MHKAIQPHICISTRDPKIESHWTKMQSYVMVTC